MQYGFISSLHIAVTVLEVLNKVITYRIIYELSVIFKPVFQTVPGTALVCNDHDMESISSSDSD